MYLYNLGATRVKKGREGIVAHNTNSNRDYNINEDMLKVLRSARGSLTLEKASMEVTGSAQNLVFKSIIDDFVKKGVLGYCEQPKDNGLLYREDLTAYPLNLVYFEPTARCNLECIHCFAQCPEIKDSVPEMDEKEAKKTIDKIDKKGVMDVCLTGGEIMYHPNALNIMEDIRNRGMRFGILTNGVLFNEKRISRLKDLQPSFIAVSLDSYKESTHNYIRQGNSFKHTSRNIKKMVEAGLKPRVNHTLFSGLNDSLEDIKSFMKYVSSLGIGSGNITFDEFCPEGKGSRLSNYSPDERESINKVKLAFQDIFGLDLNDVKSMMPESSFCGVGIDTCCIKSDGTLTPCPALYDGAHNLGNVSELDKVWEQSEMLNFLRRKEYLTKGDCGSCQSLESCLGGCRAKALTFGGSLNARDPWMCAYNGK
jgi:radical SAM protein with 4Fe4S-binding SPASM domain|tara:strand:+ start:424 stop:1695 length:1272 start_codon:yes stop_codon:yes gene_type:complete